MVSNVIKFVYRGLKTKRYHTEETIAPQSVGEHSCGVAMLIHLMAPNCSKELILAALTHDLAEHVVGDVPAPAKRANAVVKEAFDDLEESLLNTMGLNYAVVLTTEERRLLKIADIMDGMLYCINERSKGNKLINHVYMNFDSYLMNMDLTEVQYAVATSIRKMWEIANDCE